MIMASTHLHEELCALPVRKGPSEIRDYLRNQNWPSERYFGGRRSGVRSSHLIGPTLLNLSVQPSSCQRRDMTPKAEIDDIRTALNTMMPFVFMVS
jgi:hypothetical protein